MNTSMRNLIVIGSMVLCCMVGMNAQGTDPRMAKDLEVMERIVEEMFTSSSRGTFGGDAKAEYTEGYGIVINTPARRSFAVLAPTVRTQSGATIITSNSSDRDGEFDQEDVEDLMRMFIVSYGDLASGLKRGEKLLLVHQVELHHRGIYFGDKTEPAKITAMVTKEDIESFRKGDLSEKDFQERIELKVVDPSSSNGPFEYKMLGNILKDILGETEKDNFHINVGESDERVIRINGFGRDPRVTHQILEGYGVTYTLKFPSNSLLSVRTKKNGKVQKITKLRLEDYNEEEDGEYEKAHDELFMESYQNSVQQIKDAMVEYGRTLREMDAEEVLVVKLDLGGCYNCDAPAEIMLQVKKSVLEKYDRRDIDLDQAISQINVSESGKATDVDIRLPFFIDIDDANYKFDFDWDWD